MLLAFAVFYVLGFALYSLVYAAAGSLVSRPEDLQIIALPLSIVAIAGYGMGLLALTGGITGFIRLASYVPFWSPFVMLTRLSVGRVEPWELVLSVSLLVATILVTSVVAIRIYGAGVLLYGQRPGLRAYVAAARGAVGRSGRLVLEEQRQPADQGDDRRGRGHGLPRAPAQMRRRGRSAPGDERRRRTARAGS